MLTVEFKERLWLYALVTGVALLIWFWAAAETREKGGATMLVRFDPSTSSAQVVSPRERDVTVELEGSRLAIQSARTLTTVTLTVGDELPSRPGRHRVDLAEALQRDEAIRDTGVGVLSADPSFIDVRIDDLVIVDAAIKEHLPGIEFDGDVTVTPSEATVSLPAELRERLGDNMAVEAQLLQTSLEGLEPGRAYSLPAKLNLRMPPELKNDWAVVIKPPAATISFKVLSRIKSLVLPTVRVQLAGPPEDYDEYQVEVVDRAISDVTIRAENTLIQQIERGQATIVALVHLSTREKERRIESKPVTCFMALLPDGRVSVIDAGVAGATQAPVVRLKITERPGT